MSYYERCPVCDKFDLVATHKCAPAWWACGDPKGEDYTPMTVYANKAADAGEMYAMKHDRINAQFRDYQDVYVRRVDGDQTLYKIDVRMEPEPVYSSFGEPVVYVPEPDDEEVGDAD